MHLPSCIPSDRTSHSLAPELASARYVNDLNYHNHTVCSYKSRGEAEGERRTQTEHQGSERQRRQEDRAPGTTAGGKTRTTAAEGARAAGRTSNPTNARHHPGRGGGQATRGAPGTQDARPPREQKQEFFTFFAIKKSKKSFD